MYAFMDLDDVCIYGKYVWLKYMTFMWPIELNLAPNFFIVNLSSVQGTCYQNLNNQIELMDTQTTFHYTSSSSFLE